MQNGSGHEKWIAFWIYAIVRDATPKVIFTTFGDALRVPGSRKSLLTAKAEGADVRLVYSPMDALKIARQNPAKEVIFFALGFETTMPSTALTVLQAEREGLRNFSVFCNHITIIPTIKAILDSPELTLDGFIGPGHVSMVIGISPYHFITRHYRKPIVIAGFEPLDILQSVWMVLRQLAEARCEVENQYQRIVPDAGNGPALSAINRVFELREFFEWRGLGSIDLTVCANTPNPSTKRAILTCGIFTAAIWLLTTFGFHWPKVS